MPRFAPLAVALALAATALPAQAQSTFDPANMSDAEREAFRAEVRAYLLDNPEVIMEAVAVLDQRKAEQQVAQDSTLVQVNADAIRDDGYSWVGGNPDGDVTVVEFLDYRCGYCRKAFEEVKRLIEADGGVRFVVKEYPILSEESLVAARFAVATKQVAGDDAYEQVHDAMMTYNGSYDETALTRLAEGFGIEPQPILDRMDSDEVTREIAETRALAQRLQINGTPSFVIGDQMLRGYAPLATMQAMVEDARAE